MQAINGKTIRNRRRELNMTLEECCDGICSPSYLSMIENGKRALNGELMDKLSERLGLHEVNSHSRFTQEALFTSGVIALRSGRIDEAVALLAEFPESTFQRTLQALVFEYQKHHRRSIQLLRQVMSEDIEPLLFLLAANALVRQLFDEGEMESMLEIGEFALRKVEADKRPVDDAVVELKATLATAYATLGNTNRGLELSRNTPTPQNTRWSEVVENWSKASVLLHAGQMAPAAASFRAAFEQMIEFDRPVGRARLLRAAVVCELAAGSSNLEVAGSELEHALKVFLDSNLVADVIETRHALAMLEFKRGNLAKSLEHALQSAADLADLDSPKAAIMHVDLAAAFYDLGEVAHALKELAAATQLLADSKSKRLSAVAWTRLGLLYEKLGDEKSAYHAMKQSVSLSGLGGTVVGSLGSD